MSGIEILPDELINIVEEYVDKVYLRKVDNIRNLIDHDLYTSIYYSPTIIIFRMRNQYEIFYKKQHKKIIYMEDTDRCAILNETSIIYNGYIVDLETLQSTSCEKGYYINKNEGVLNTFDYDKKMWSRYNHQTSPCTIITAKGNIWEIQNDKLMYNGKISKEISKDVKSFGKIVSPISSSSEIMCSINNDTVIIYNKWRRDISVYSFGKLQSFEGSYYRFYGREYVVDFDNGDVFKIELIDLKKIFILQN